MEGSTRQMKSPKFAKEESERAGDTGLLLREFSPASPRVLKGGLAFLRMGRSGSDF